MGHFRHWQTLQDCEDALLPLKEESGTNGKPARISPAAQECISKLHNDFETKLADDLHTPSILNAALQEAFRFINTSVNLLKAGICHQYSLSPPSSILLWVSTSLSGSDNLFFWLLQKKQQKQLQLSIVKSLIDLEKEVKEVLDVLGLLSSSTYAEVPSNLFLLICISNNFGDSNVTICFIGHSVQVLQQLKDKALKRAVLTEDDVLHSIEERMLARKNKEFSKSDQIRSDLAAKGIALMDVGKETVWRPCVPVQQEQPGEPAQQEKPGILGEQENPPLPAEKCHSAVPADK